MKKFRILMVLLVVVLTAGLLVTACKPSAPTAAPTDAPTEAPAVVGPTVEEPIAEPAAEAAEAEEPVVEASEESTVPAETAAEPVDEEAAKPANDEAVDYSKLKIGVLLHLSRDDGGWSQAQYESFIRTKEELGLTDDQVIIVENIGETGPVAENMIEQLVSEGCNVIFGTSSSFMNAIQKGAERHPDIYFHHFEYNFDTPNVKPYSIRDTEAIFVLGYVSGLMSNSDSLGFVAAQPQASVIRAINSFAAGARYARENATVQVVWVNSWFDPAKDKESALSLIDSGINALGYQGSTSAVAQASAEKGTYCTGFHIDMHDYAPSAVLTSFMWNWTPIFNQILKDIALDQWTNDTIVMGITENAAQVAPFNEEIIPADILAKAEEVKAKCMAGEIKALEGPVVDNKGETILKEGESFTDEQLIQMMFLLDNVKGNLP